MSCVEIASIIPTSTWRLDALEVSLAVIFGVIIGVILAIIISRCFVKELAKDRIHKHQDDSVVKNAAYEVEVAGYADMTYRKTKSSTVNEKSSRQMLIQEDDENEKYEKKNREDEFDDDDGDEDDNEGEMKAILASGIIIALTMPSSERTLVELSLQDFQATKSMEKELLEERESVFVHILEILLGRFVAAEKMDEKYAADFIDKTSQELHEAKDSLEATQLMVEQDLKNRSNLIKDPLALEEALENSRSDYIRKKDGLVQDAQIRVKDKLSREAGLSSDEVEAIMKKLLENMAAAERMIGQEQNRQATILNERLSKRQALSEQYSHVTTRENKANQARVRSVNEVANYLAQERELNQSQAKSLMKQYQADLEQIQENHKAAVLKQSQELADKLQQHRERKLRALEKKQEEKREKLAAKAPQVVNPTDFVEAHHDLLEQQRNEKNDLIDELDYHEAEELSLLRKTLEEERGKELAEKDKSLFEELVERAQLNEKEANRIVKKHQANVTAYEEQLDQEKKRQNMLLQEKIELRKASWEEEQKRAAAEQQQLAEQQERTISKLIDTQSALDEESKRQIMLQHEQNVSALNNHLQMTKLKQQKLLEAKLAKRRAHYEALKEEHSKDRLSRGEEDDEEESQLTTKQAEELAAEEEAMKEEQQAAILALRKQLTKETEEVLKEQDAKMGILIGKLQVGQARRQGVIKKLDKAVKDLQDQLVDSIADSNVISERKTERIMAAHMQEIEEIEEKLRQARAHQEDQLQQKMETIKLMREKTLAEELKKEAKPSNDSRRDSSAGALQMMTKILESNRQKQALRQLEQEMKVETLKQKEELNEQLEDALEQELQERERDFLGQLAALSQLSKDELNNMVQTAIAEDGGNENDAKKLSKDLNKRIKTAMTRPDMDPEAENDEPVEEKPKKKKKKKGKKAPPPDEG
ncbi:trichohyalin-like isoform X2 [Lytechinus variegatus]|uniref:trichohyalin-like isoform X2 n=1 Tax=Lytechinus variegatus TaxID=7654 RepID=UPI001BB12DF7|nr:trichohyalin-like isoform X2 [Lytechinus variegatus]